MRLHALGRDRALAAALGGQVAASQARRQDRDAEGHRLLAQEASRSRKGTTVTFAFRDDGTAHNVISTGAKRFKSIAQPDRPARSRRTFTQRRHLPLRRARSTRECPGGSSSADLHTPPGELPCPICSTLTCSTSTAPSATSAEAAGLDRSDFLKKGVLAGGGLLAGSALFSQSSASPRPRSRRSKSKKQRRQDPQLRADARVPRGRVLQAGRRQQGLRHERAAEAASPRSSPTTRPSTSTFLKRRARLRRRSSRRRSTSATPSPTRRRSPRPLRCSRTRASPPTSARSPTSPQGAVLAAAGTIATVEARHAALDPLHQRRADAPDGLPAPRFDKRKSEKAILKAVGDDGLHQVAPPDTAVTTSERGPSGAPPSLRRAALSAARRPASSNVVIRCSSSTRSTISSPVSRATRSVPNSSTL